MEPQALENDKNETFNRDLWKYNMILLLMDRKVGELGLLAPTVSEEFGGGGMDAVFTCV